MLYNIYFSPTGGTLKTADILCQQLRKELGISPSEKTIPVDLLQKTFTAPVLTQADLCVVSVPAYGGRVPESALQKLKTISGNGAGAVLVAVYGNRAIDDTLIELQDVLAAGGFHCIAAVEAVAEHSLARMYGAGRPDAEDAKELQVYGAAIAARYSEYHNQEQLPAEAKEATASLNVPGNRPYKDFQPSPMMPVVDSTCCNCKRCARECPVDAISTEDIHVTDPARCFSCMHCVAVCPMKARHDAPARMQALEERLRDRCAGRKENRLYVTAPYL